MMAMLRLVDVSDRNFNTWWTEFTTLNNAYLARVAADPTLFCSDWPGLQQELNTLQEKSNLVGLGNMLFDAHIFLLVMVYISVKFHLQLFTRTYNYIKKRSFEVIPFLFWEIQNKTQFQSVHPSLAVIRLCTLFKSRG